MPVDPGYAGRRDGIGTRPRQRPLRARGSQDADHRPRSASQHRRSTWRAGAVASTGVSRLKEPRSATRMPNRESTPPLRLYPAKSARTRPIDLSSPRQVPLSRLYLCSTRIAAASARRRARPRANRASSTRSAPAALPRRLFAPGVLRHKRTDAVTLLLERNAARGLAGVWPECRHTVLLSRAVLPSAGDLSREWGSIAACLLTNTITYRGENTLRRGQTLQMALHLSTSSSTVDASMTSAEGLEHPASRPLRLY